MKKGKQIKPLSTFNKRPPSKRLQILLTLMCGGLAFLLYANTLTHDYAVDDETAIVKNQFTQAGIPALPKIFSTAYRAGFDDRKEGLYRPLSIAMFAVEWQVSPANPHLNHGINVLLYVLTATLLFLILIFFFEGQNLVIPFVSTLLFVAHPTHTEVVANIKSRDEILSFLFSLISIWAIVKYARRDKMLYAWVAGIAIFLGMLSKETALTLIAIAPLSVYFFSKPTLRKIIFSTLPFVAAAVIYIAIRVSVLEGLSNFGEIAIINNSLVGTTDPVTRFATAVSIIGRYLWVLLLPTQLCFDYSYNTIPLVSLTDSKALFSLVVIVALVFFVVRGFKSRNPIAWGILFIGITLSPVANILFLIEATMAERFLYLPSLGFSVVITLLLAHFLQLKKSFPPNNNFWEFITANRAMLAIGTALVLLYGVKTISRNADWKDDLTLMQADVKTHPNSVRIRYAYGSVLVMIKALNEKNPETKVLLLDEGIRQLTAAVNILPDYGDAWFNLGMAYKEKEDYKNAIVCFEHAREHIMKTDVQFYIASGIAYGEDKQYSKAFQLLGKAIELDSSSAEAYNNLGMFYSVIANYPKSLEMLNKAMQLDPESDVAYYNAGNTYAEMNNFKTAIEYYQKSLALNPNSEIARINLGNSYAALKDYPNALSTFKKVLELNPSNKNARNNIGLTYFLMGDTANAQMYLPKN